MRSLVLLTPLLFALLLPLAACGDGTSGVASAAPAEAPTGDVEKRIAKLEARLLVEIRQLREEQAKLIRQQQEIGRTHLEEISEDLQFQMGKLLQFVTRLERHVFELMDRVQTRGDVGQATAAAEEKLYSPEMRAEIAKKLADRGIVLSEDRVEVAGFIGPGRGAPLEYFAVLRGGKEHEAVVVVTGSYGADERLPKGLATGLNLACQALNLPRGTPTRWLDGDRSIAAAGTPVHMYVEWMDGDETVRVRAEDLVFNDRTNAPMEHGTWIYVGSRFLRNSGTGQRDFMAEITGSVAATFGSENAILANASPEASDVNQANFFRGYAPRIPEEGTEVKLVISREPLEAKTTFGK